MYSLWNKDQHTQEKQDAEVSSYWISQTTDMTNKE